VEHRITMLVGFRSGRKSALVSVRVAVISPYVRPVAHPTLSIIWFISGVSSSPMMRMGGLASLGWSDPIALRPYAKNARRAIRPKSTPLAEIDERIRAMSLRRHRTVPLQDPYGVLANELSENGGSTDSVPIRSEDAR
jgi:hypothetical protein